MNLQSVKKEYFLDSHHSIDPKKTVAMATEALAKMGSDYFGGLEEIGGLDFMGLPVYKVVCKNGLNEWGKGITKEQCMASATMERVERISSVYSNNSRKLSLTDTAFNEIKGRAISRWELGPCNIHRILIGEDGMNKIKMDWIESESLTDGKKYLVPAHCVYLRYPRVNFPEYTCSTGLSAGNTIEESIQQALCEIVERHSLHIAICNRQEVSQLDLDSVKNEYLKKILFDLKKKGFEVIVNLFSTDWNLVTMSAFIFHPEDSRLFRPLSYTATGTSTDPEIAATRAITEVAQSRAAAIKNGRTKDTNLSFFNAVSDEIKNEFEWRSNCRKKVLLSDIPNFSLGDFKKEIENVVQALEKDGYNTIWSDLTHPKMNIPVVRVMVPKLQPNFHLLGRKIDDKEARVTEHLDAYERILGFCQKRIWRNQKIDEFYNL